jgi:tRNA G18 (ribose-2'-O)-methylase SpoU
MVGTEGRGLSPEALAEADWRVRIDMAPGVDSLNVATAAAIALHELARRRARPAARAAS